MSWQVVKLLLLTSAPNLQYHEKCHSSHSFRIHILNLDSVFSSVFCSAIATMQPCAFHKQLQNWPELVKDRMEIYFPKESKSKQKEEQTSKLLVLHNAFSIVSCLGAEEDLVCISNLGRKGTMTNKQTNKGEMIQTVRDRKGKMTNKQTRGIPSPLSPMSSIASTTQNKHRRNIF